LLPGGILIGAKFTLRPSFAFSYIGSVTALHSSSGSQQNYAALRRGRHLYSAAPSRWTSAHILAIIIIITTITFTFAICCRPSVCLSVCRL